MEPFLLRPAQKADMPALPALIERKALDYKIAPNERAEVQTIASRSGAAWTVLIIDATEHTWETRAAAFGLVLQSIRPKGYVPESFAGRTPNRLDPARMAAVRAFLVEAMKQAGVVGASFALLEKGAVVYEGGIGVREQGNSAAVDADTVFMAGGNTKGMSSLLLATLVDQGKLRWDQPVIEVYPAFRLGDAQATSKVLVKDLVCDCAGPPGIDLERGFEFKAASPQTSMALRQNNHDLMASAAGYIGGQLPNQGSNSVRPTTRRCKSGSSARSACGRPPSTWPAHCVPTTPARTAATSMEGRYWPRCR
jgi:hypothetical protein